MEIYTIMGCTKCELRNDWEINFGDSRIVGYYTSLKDAQEAVLDNLCDIWETYYDFVVIEKVEEGLYNCSKERYFYKYIYTMKRYIQIEEPEGFNKFIGLTIG